jgi:hypothetical protein
VAEDQPLVADVDPLERGRLAWRQLQQILVAQVLHTRILRLTAML